MSHLESENDAYSKANRRLLECHDLEMFLREVVARCDFRIAPMLGKMIGRELSSTYSHSFVVRAPLLD